MGIDIRLYVKTKRQKTKDELRDINYRFLEACNLGWGVKPIAMDIDEKGEPYYSVDTLTRYYGPGYARGDFGTIYMAIEWLRRNFEDATICYGGDNSSDGIEDTPELTKEDQEELLEMWSKTGGLTYRQNIPENEQFRRPCPNCEVIMSQYMWSGNHGGICCQGCKHKEETKDGGITWEVINKK